MKSIRLCALAASIFFILATQLLEREVSRALMKLGTAIASRMPMISTTIIISTRSEERRVGKECRFGRAVYLVRLIPIYTSPLNNRKQSDEQINVTEIVTN